MAKKSKSKGTRENIHGKDNFHRMNYLYQVAHYAMSSGMKDVAAHYIHVMSGISQKTQSKIEPDIKRGICKGCCVILQPGVTARVRVKNARVIWTCLRCGTLKRFPTKRGYKLWADREEACLDIFEFPSVLLRNNESVSCKDDATDTSSSFSPVCTKKEDLSSSSVVSASDSNQSPLLSCE